MKKAIAIIVFGLLWCNVGFALPECEGKDDSKWSNCQGTYLKKEVRSGLTRDYTGEFGSAPGKRHGKGSSKTYDGSFTSTYVGEFKDDKPHGQGTALRKSGDKYVGEWKDGIPNGQGTYTYVDGRQYVGEFKNGKMHGIGTYTLTNGEKYVGEWKDQKMHGQGTYTWPNGEKYVGEFKDGEPIAVGVGEFKRLSHGYKKLDYNFKCLPGMQIFESNPNWEKSTNFGFLKVKNPFITSDEKYVLLHATWGKTYNEYNFPNSVVTETSLKDPKLSKLFEWYEQVGRAPVSTTEESSTIWQNILFKSKKKPYKYMLQTKIVKIPDEDYKTINDGIDESLNDWMNENPSELNDDAFVESLWFIGKLQSGFYKRYSNDMVAKVTLSCKSF